MGEREKRDKMNKNKKSEKDERCLHKIYKTNKTVGDELTATRSGDGAGKGATADAYGGDGVGGGVYWGFIGGRDE